MATSEVQQAISDPNYAIGLAVGPPFPELVPQTPGSGLVLCHRCENEPRRFIFKKAHFSREDYRIFDSSGRVVACLWHHGKNPYSGFDPLSTSNFVQAHNNYMGEWESAANLSGYNGMTSLKIRPKAVSRHGRQWVYDWNGALLFNIGKESKLKHLALRSNIAVRKGEGKEILYRILPDLLGRTFQVVNPEGQLVCFAQKSAKTMILEAALGAGSEMIIDVAPGADWTAMVAIVMALRQVGAHFLKDAFKNYVFDPLKGAVVSGAIEASGMSEVAQAAGSVQDAAMEYVRKAQHIHQVFYS